LKPPPFVYEDPRSLPEALALVAEHGDEAKVLAGGQSLLPLLNFRLAQPSMLVDVNRLNELASLRRSDGVLRVGAMCRQARLELSPMVAEGWPLLREAVGLVAHPQIRNRGTVGGSAAHADPAAELPVALRCLDARFKATSTRGDRVLASGEFFLTHLTTALESDEVLTEIEVPALPPRTGHAFCEYSRRHGDFALGGAAVLYTLDEQGNCSEARIALLGAADTPFRATEAERALRGRPPSEESAAEVAGIAVADIEPTGDIHGSSAYRKRLIGAMVRRALVKAGERASNGVER
jgi:carbon-monoxide dehydrogenase medium subunit/6-hydroxypseudooxynicotine dehydrogenase subunit alpha